MSLEIRVKKDDSTCLITALIDNKPIGKCQGVSVAGSSSIVLEKIVVEPSARRNGAGSAMLEAVKNWGREIGATEMCGAFGPDADISRKHARRFYEKNGVTVTRGNWLRCQL